MTHIERNKEIILIKEIIDAKKAKVATEINYIQFDFGGITIFIRHRCWSSYTRHMSSNHHNKQAKKSYDYYNNLHNSHVINN